MQLREAIDRTNKALRRLSRAGDSDAEAEAAEAELEEQHIPALELEDAYMARVTRETLAWMKRERAAFKRRRDALGEALGRKTGLPTSAG